nr:replication endonuclease [Azospirillum oleiclasticum]
MPSLRRRLRRWIGRADAHAAAVLGLVGGRPGGGGAKFVTNWSLGRWEQVQAKNEAFLAEREAVSEVGKVVNLAMVANESVKAAAASWYAIVLGMEERARRVGYVAVFVTATLPPRYHLNPRHGDAEHGDPALSPWIGAQELARRWHAALCLARQRGVNPFGVRTVEPHTDGCPHAHALLYVAPDELGDLEASLRQHFPADGGDANAALKVRLINGGTAAPTSYVMHYVLKCVGPADDEETRRFRAWASHVGVRRLSLVGLRQGTIGLFRAAYRTTKSDTPPAEPRARAVYRAMRRKRWATALALLGAWSVTPRFRPEREIRVNCWGEDVRHTIGWCNARTGKHSLARQPVRWAIRKITNVLIGNALSIVTSYPRGAPPDGGVRQRPPDKGQHDP